MEVLILHKYPQLFDQCCDLINSEWPRSRTARLRGLECSCDQLPTCLVMVQKLNTSDALRVVGHSKISRIPAIEMAGFIESVVIDRSLRGQGLGRKLMLETEKYMKSIGLTIAYLSTYDQQSFYKKIGYDFCERVSIYGSSIPTYHKREPVQERPKQVHEGKESIRTNPSTNIIPPPPPLPIVNPQVITKVSTLPTTNKNLGNTKKDFMKKNLM